VKLKSESWRVQVPPSIEILFIPTQGALEDTFAIPRRATASSTA
jgi:hypothetical protein